MSPKASPAAGQTRSVDGQIQFFSGSKWVNYPKKASDLIYLAHQQGWGVNDGIPDIGDCLKQDNETGKPFLRILVGRKRDEKHGACQYHVTWDSTPSSWELATIYVIRDDGKSWRQVKMLREVRAEIINAPVVRVPLFV